MNENFRLVFELVYISIIFGPRIFNFVRRVNYSVKSFLSVIFGNSFFRKQKLAVTLGEKFRVRISVVPYILKISMNFVTILLVLRAQWVGQRGLEALGTGSYSNTYQLFSTFLILNLKLTDCSFFTTFRIIFFC